MKKKRRYSRRAGYTNTRVLREALAEERVTRMPRPREREQTITTLQHSSANQFARRVEMILRGEATMTPIRRKISLDMD